MLSHADTLLNYCLSIAQEFEARLNRIRVFIKHNLTSGTANEIILRDFLASHSPKDFFVGQGFICDPSLENKVSKQCDILVYQQSSYPVVYEDGPIKIVWPDSARMVIEIKTNLAGNSIKSAIENIEAARKVSIHTKGIIFAFSSARLETILQHMKKHLRSISSNHIPTAILLFNDGLIIHQTNEPSTYVARKAKQDSDKSAIVITYLMLIFFDSVWKSAQGTHGANTYTILQEMLDKHTDLVEKINLTDKEILPET